MTLRGLIESGTTIEGYIKIQCWEDEDNPTIYAEGSNNNIDIPEEYMDREISYIFPYEAGIAPGICIELLESE